MESETPSIEAMGHANSLGVRDPFCRLAFVLIAGTALSMFVAPLVSVVRGPVGPWRGTWFPTRDFKGTSQIRHTSDINFDWGSSPAMPGWSPDNWSVIFDTCLEVSEDTEVRFAVTSDDGSRLSIDGEQLIDNWGNHAAKTVEKSIGLAEGTHHVQLKYFEALHTAKLILTAAFGSDEETSAIPQSMLVQPGRDDHNPCS